MYKLRILYIGDLSYSARSRMMLCAMKDLGHEVDGVSSTVLNVNGEKIVMRDPISRISWKIGFPIDHASVNKKTINKIEKDKYDLLWLSKPLELRSSTLSYVKKLYPDIRIAFYSEDDMFTRHNQSRYFLNSLKLYDVVFTTKSYNCKPEELPSLGARHVEFVDKSFDKKRHRPIKLTAAEREKFKAKVGFIGSFENMRAKAMLYLAKNDIDVRVRGPAWPSRWLNKHPKLKVENIALLGDDYIRGICATDINLCFLRKANRDLQTDRTMEIPACGAFMLAERTREHMRLFKEGEEAEFFTSNSEMLRKIQFYLTNEEKRKQIAQKGRERCLKSGYSFQDRLPNMLSIAMSASNR